MFRCTNEFHVIETQNPPLRIRAQEQITVSSCFKQNLITHYVKSYIISIINLVKILQIFKKIYIYLLASTTFFRSVNNAARPFCGMRV